MDRASATRESRKASSAAPERAASTGRPAWANSAGAGVFDSAAIAPIAAAYSSRRVRSRAVVSAYSAASAGKRPRAARASDWRAAMRA